MGLSWRDADEWDFVPYSAALREWNKRAKEENDNDEVIESEPPPIEWMIADDVRLADRGIKVH